MRIGTILLMAAALAAPAVLAAPAALAAMKQGDPIPGREIVIEGEPYGIVLARGMTNANGVAMLRWAGRAGQRARVFVDRRGLRQAIVAQVAVGREVRPSQPIQPGRGRALVMFDRGQNWIVADARARITQVTVTLTEAGPAAQP